jgi:hypothetical protein
MSNPDRCRRRGVDRTAVIDCTGQARRNEQLDPPRRHNDDDSRSLRAMAAPTTGSIRSVAHAFLPPRNKGVITCSDTMTIRLPIVESQTE